MKFQKKPVIIDAYQWDGKRECAEAISQLFPELRTNSFEYDYTSTDTEPTGWIICTLEGLITAKPNDWIIKGVQGEFYPCKPDIFGQTYSFWSAG